jgi:hypothetical protein
MKKLVFVSTLLGSKSACGKYRQINILFFSGGSYGSYGGYDVILVKTRDPMPDTVKKVTLGLFIRRKVQLKG